jgi:signal transduction histidine kinase
VGCTFVSSADGRRSRVSATARPVDLDGEPAVLLLLRDETSERHIEAELRRNESMLDAVLETTSDGVLVIAEERGRAVVRMTNRAFAEMVRLDVDDLLGASEDRLLRLLHERGEGVEAVAHAIGAGRSPGPRETISLGGPAPREIQVGVERLVGAGGESLGRVVACRDVTAQRRSERELQAHADRLQLGKVELERSHRELNEVNERLAGRGAELDRLNRELRRLDEMKSDLLGNVSHELQTPLVSIRGYTEMILKERLGPISEEQRKGLTLSLRNIDRLISMIDNLLEFSRPDAAPSDLAPSRFALRGVVDEVLEVLGARIAAKGIRVTVDAGGDELEVEADRDKIVQVFLNLMSNAVAYNRPAGAIHVAASPAGAGQVTVRIRDTGVGIPEEEQGRIFDRHFRGRRAGEDRVEGSGIGLAIVRDILRQHGCSIGVESREGQGSVFTFTLPLAPREAVREQRAAPPRSRRAEDAAAPPAAPETESPPPSGDAAPPGTASQTIRPRLRIIRRFKSRE